MWGVWFTVLWQLWIQSTCALKTLAMSVGKFRWEHLPRNAVLPLWCILPLLKTSLVCLALFIMIDCIWAFRTKFVSVGRGYHYKNLIKKFKSGDSPKCDIVLPIFGRPAELSIVLNAPLKSFAASDTFPILYCVVLVHLLDADDRQALSMFTLKTQAPISRSNSC